jgi:hypothetical protein
LKAFIEDMSILALRRPGAADKVIEVAPDLVEGIALSRTTGPKKPR